MIWRIASASRMRASSAAMLLSNACITAASARSTITGAWSDGDWPLRALRSITVHASRAATGAEPSTRSMRKPRPWWKSPAR